MNKSCTKRFQIGISHEEYFLTNKEYKDLIKWEECEDYDDFIEACHSIEAKVLSENEFKELKNE